MARHGDRRGFTAPQRSPEELVQRLAELAASTGGPTHRHGRRVPGAAPSIRETVPSARRPTLPTGGDDVSMKALLRRPPISTRARRRRLSRDLKLRLPAPSSKPGLPWHGMVPSLPARRPKLRLGDPPSPTARRHRRPSDRHRGRRAADATLGSSSAPRWEKLRGYVWATELGRPKASRVLRTGHRSARASAAGPRAGCDNPDGCRRPGAVCSAEAGGGFGRRGREAPERTRGHASCAGCTRRCC